MLTAEGIQEATAVAREGLSGQLQSFAQNTMEYLVREKDLLIDGVGVPTSSPSSTAGTRADRRAVITTRKTCSAAGTTSGNTSRCWIGVDVEPMRC